MQWNRETHKMNKQQSNHVTQNLLPQVNVHKHRTATLCIISEKKLLYQ